MLCFAALCREEGLVQLKRPLGGHGRRPPCSSSLAASSQSLFRTWVRHGRCPGPGQAAVVLNASDSNACRNTPFHFIICFGAALDALPRVRRGAAPRALCHRALYQLTPLSGLFKLPCLGLFSHCLWLAVDCCSASRTSPLLYGTAALVSALVLQIWRCSSHQIWHCPPGAAAGASLPASTVLQAAAPPLRSTAPANPTRLVLPVPLCFQPAL